MTVRCGDNRSTHFSSESKLGFMTTEEIAVLTPYRLIRLIEMRSNELASCLLERVNSDALADYEFVPDEDLKDRVYKIYRHLREWLITKDEFELEQLHLGIGAQRAKQGVPFSRVVWAITLAKENLWVFLRR